ncbi:MAG: ACT domain-containing protein [Candidatus Micrarchaeota archaeon]
MPKSFLSKLDGRGRVMIPISLRETLGLKEGSPILIKLDGEGESVRVIPFVTEGEELAFITVEMGDAPGALSKILNLLSARGVDIIKSESISSERGRSAEWRALVNVSGCKLPASALKNLLLKEKVARAVRMTKF